MTDVAGTRRHRPGMRLAAACALASIPVAARGITCTVSGNPIAFGAYNAVTKAQVATSSSLSINCTGAGNLSFVISLSPGQGGNQIARRLASGSNTLSYQVYKDTGYTQIFGDGNGGTYTFSGSGTLGSGGATGTANFYARIAAGQAVAPGSYSDVLMLQITY